MSPSLKSLLKLTAAALVVMAFCVPDARANYSETINVNDNNIRESLGATTFDLSGYDGSQGELLGATAVIQGTYQLVAGREFSYASLPHFLPGVFSWGGNAGFGPAGPGHTFFQELYTTTAGQTQFIGPDVPIAGVEFSDNIFALTSPGELIFSVHAVDGVSASGWSDDTTFGGTITVEFITAPEPSSISILLFAGLLGLAVRGRRPRFAKTVRC